MSATQEMIQDKESADSIGDNESIGMPSILSKKRRGKNQGIPASADNTRMHIKLNCHGVACGKFAKKLGTQMGIYVRNVSISYRSWKEVQMEWKNTLWEDFIQRDFDIPIEGRNWCMNRMSDDWRGYKLELASKYILPDLSRNDILKNIPDGITSKEWESFVDYRMSDEFKEKIDQALVNVDDGDDEDVVGKALGKKKGWVKGYGTGITASSLRASKPTRKRLAIERDRNEKLHDELTEMKKDIATIRTLVITQMERNATTSMASNIASSRDSYNAPSAIVTTDDGFPVHCKVELMTWTSSNPVAIGTIEYATPETIVHHSPLGLHFKKITLIEVIDHQADLPKKSGMVEKLDDIGEGGIVVWPSAFLRKMD